MMMEDGNNNVNDDNNTINVIEVEDQSTYKIKCHDDSIYNVSIDIDGCTICSGGK